MFPWAIFVPQIDSLSVVGSGVSLGCLGRVQGISWMCYSDTARNELKWEIIDMKEAQFPHKFILLDTLGKI